METTCHSDGDNNLFVRIVAIAAAILMFFYTGVSIASGDAIMTAVCGLIAIILLIIERLIGQYERIENLLRENEKDKRENAAQRLRADRGQQTVPMPERE